MKCKICPRNCNINRHKQKGYCGCSDKISISKIMFHHWEEPIISGNAEAKGSGAIFFNGCNLKCVYCQNYEISSGENKNFVSVKELAKIFKTLEDKGALNINLVTPSHYTKQIISALKIYKPRIPVIWNSSGYENYKEIRKLKKYVDIYLVDLKYMDKSLAKTLSNANDYPEKATKTIIQMRKNQPADEIKNNLMTKGMIIRHLVLPNCVKNSFSCLDWIDKNLGKKVYISLMSQYLPCFKAKDYEMINRRLKPIEYKRVITHFNKLGLENGFIQELSSASEKYIPDFNLLDISNEIK